MTSSDEASKSLEVTKYLAIAFAAMTFIYFKDFSNDHAVRHALGGIGFALLGYGTFKNGFVTEARNLGGRYASLVGAAFLIGSAIAATAPAITALVDAMR